LSPRRRRLRHRRVPGQRRPGTGDPEFAAAFDDYDLSDFLNDTCRPTNNLITTRSTKAGVATFALPGPEVGQGINTSDGDDHRRGIGTCRSPKVQVTLADCPAGTALTTTHRRLDTRFTRSTSPCAPPPRRRVVSSRQLRRGALGPGPRAVRTANGQVHARTGATLDYGALTEAAASATDHQVKFAPEAPQAPSPVIRTVRRAAPDARAAVTGNQDVRNGLSARRLPTMVAGARR